MQTGSYLSSLWKAQEQVWGEYGGLLNEPPASVPMGQPDLQPGSSGGQQWIKTEQNSAALGISWQ